MLSRIAQNGAMVIFEKDKIELLSNIDKKSILILWHIQCCNVTSNKGDHLWMIFD